jgi:hypothetical protein
VVVPHPALSRRHLQVTRRGDWFVLDDLHGRSGIWLNRQRLLGLYPLRQGDRIRIAEFEAVFESPPPVVTEAEWLDSGSSQLLLAWVQGHVAASERQLRLLAIACYRHHRLRWEDEGAGRAEQAERLAEGKGPVTPGEIGPGPLWATDAWQAVVDSAREAAMVASAPVVWGESRAAGAPPVRRPWEERWAAFVEVEALLCRLVRDVFGNPFRPKPPVEPAWQGGLVATLAQAAYEDRKLPEGTLRGDRLAVLADALEEAGYTDARLLEHLRGPGPHVRGCFALDAVLGKG